METLVPQFLVMSLIDRELDWKSVHSTEAEAITALDELKANAENEDACWIQTVYGFHHES